MCAGRATHHPTSNRGDQIACRNKSVDSRRQQCRLFQRKPLAPRDGSGGRPYAQTAAAPALRSPNRIFGFPVNNQGAAKRALLALSLASFLLWRLSYRYSKLRKIYSQQITAKMAFKTTRQNTADGKGQRDTYRFLSIGVGRVCRAPKLFLGQLSSLIHRSNALGSSHG
ncbi:hypothetical protein ZIOFF_074465 (mitochondrion) [Zingiber officinale]|uniref:Uncharacterized protein n=1 Tax=Zingiber officinale TaxID=94328 RepID=A0A8J5EKV5_ZINOF|nr:hypothetical protein ZIOFF_075489 [Zingiber officinale]KAG6467062.1 hypothetical protein ZIOFF_075103 [Zingiber officinale]KAG6467670.1 hypothetical protein ZIOFF_074465 [Zingiber officinale]